MRRAEDRFLLVTGTAFGNHDRAWLERNAPRDGSVYVNDVTSAYACLCLWGPRAREVLQPLTRTPLDFAYLTSRELSVGNVPVTASRVTYVGELGWELYCPAEYGLQLWDALTGTGGVTPGGYRAIDALRLEKGYRAWGSDLNAETTPDEAGLALRGEARQGRLRRPGRASRAAARSSSASCSTIRARSRSAPSRSAPPGGEIVGRVTSGGYGYAVEASIALAYVSGRARRARHAARGRHLRRLGERRGARRAALRPDGRAGARVSRARAFAGAEWARGS